jgi:large subunit ribosomal protein L15
MKLNALKDNPGARKGRVRVGRGIGSGIGKTAGRGGKGQTARSGVAINGFEGGQMPLHMRIPKRGFNKPDPAHYVEVNLGRIQAALDAGRLKASGIVTEKALIEAGLARRAKDGIRLLAKGELKAQLSFEVTGASAPAVAAVEKAGGKVTILPPKSVPQLGPKERKRAPKKGVKAV